MIFIEKFTKTQFARDEYKKKISIKNFRKIQNSKTKKIY